MNRGFQKKCWRENASFNLVCHLSAAGILGGCGLTVKSEVPTPTPSPTPASVSSSNNPGGNSAAGSSSSTPVTTTCDRADIPSSLQRLAPTTVSPTVFVGTGTAASCTETALRDAVTQGGVIGFKCGGQQVTIPINAVIEAKVNVTLDGGSLVTLDGQNKTRIFLGNREKDLILMNLSIVNGKSSDGTGAGAIHTGWRGHLGLVNVTFDGNSNPSGNERSGGAVSTHESTAVVYGSTFKNNSGTNGGGINNLLTSLVVINTRFEKNSVTNAGGGIYTDGAAFYDNKESADRSKTLPRSIIFCGAQFEGNKAKQAGGAFLYLYADPNDGSNLDSIKISKTLFRSNEATGDSHAGGLYLQSGSSSAHVVTINESTFDSNKSAQYGGAVTAGGVFTARFTNVTFVGNDAAGPNGQGGAIFADGPVTLQNVTLWGNIAKKAGGGLAGTNKGIYTVTNSILSDNTVREPWDQNKNNCAATLNSATNTLQYLAVAPTSKACGNGILNDKNPFAGVAPALSSAAADPVPTLALPSTSAAKGAGANCATIDARGHARKPACDLGAFEL